MAATTRSASGPRTLVEGTSEYIHAASTRANARVPCTVKSLSRSTAGRKNQAELIRAPLTATVTEGLVRGRGASDAACWRTASREAARKLHVSAQEHRSAPPSEHGGADGPDASGRWARRTRSAHSSGQERPDEPEERKEDADDEHHPVPFPDGDHPEGHQEDEVEDRPERDELAAAHDARGRFMWFPCSLRNRVRAGEEPPSPSLSSRSAPYTSPSGRSGR